MATGQTTGSGTKQQVITMLENLAPPDSPLWKTILSEVENGYSGCVIRAVNGDFALTDHFRQNADSGTTGARY